MLGRVLQIALLVLPLCLLSCGRIGSGSSWPPAVSTAEEIKALPAGQKTVRCIDIGDAEVRILADRLTNLDYLYLNSRSPITDSGAEAMKSLTSLQQVVIENASNLTDASAEVFASIPGLEELMLKKGAKLTDAALVPLARHTRFRKIYLEECPGLSPAAVDELRRALPGCEIRTH